MRVVDFGLLRCRSHPGDDVVPGGAEGVELDGHLGALGVFSQLEQQEGQLLAQVGVDRVG